MTESIRFTQEAAVDISTAFDWYEDRAPGLGEDFLRCVEACTEAVLRHPEMFPVAIDPFRRALLRRFPFELFYESVEDGIIIYSVFHCSQDPARWQSRLSR